MNRVRPFASESLEEDIDSCITEFWGAADVSEDVKGAKLVFGQRNFSVRCNVRVQFARIEPVEESTEDSWTVFSECDGLGSALLPDLFQGTAEVR